MSELSKVSKRRAWENFQLGHLSLWQENVCLTALPWKAVVRGMMDEDRLSDSKPRRNRKGAEGSLENVLCLSSSQREGSATWVLNAV